MNQQNHQWLLKQTMNYINLLATPVHAQIFIKTQTQNHTYFECVCLVILRMVAPSLPMMAPTNWVGTSMRSGMSDCNLGRVPRGGEGWRGAPRGAPPLLLPTAGGSESTDSSGMQHTFSAQLSIMKPFSFSTALKTGKKKLSVWVDRTSC